MNKQDDNMLEAITKNGKCKTCSCEADMWLFNGKVYKSRLQAKEALQRERTRLIRLYPHYERFIYSIEEGFAPRGVMTFRAWNDAGPYTVMAEKVEVE